MACASPTRWTASPVLTQQPVKPQGTFIYEFDAVDAGTFWYHPHQRSSEQVDRGLYGALVVEERNSPRADRDVVWVLDDWRLTGSGAIDESFNHPMDMSHGGRLGNYATVNGGEPEIFRVRTNERVRLRLINAANARTFALDFSALTPTVIAIDGQPVAPHRTERDLIVLGASMRMDLMLDLTHPPGGKLEVIDRFSQRNPFKLIDIVYADTPMRDSVPDWPMALPPNPLSEPDLAKAQRHRVVFAGGMMAGMAARRMGVNLANGANMPGPAMMDMMRQGKLWFVNGKANDGHDKTPIFSLRHGTSHIFELTNVTAWHHPIHLHGHSFRVLSRNGKPTRHREWQDTILLNPLEKAEIAFVADNPGAWMFHCHILEHQASGMTAVIDVA